MFTVPKPFRGRVGGIQRNAIASWHELGHNVQIVLLGDEEGVATAARESGVEHIGGLARNDRGTPLLDSAFALVERVARYPVWCFLNADILLLDDFLPAVERVASAFRSYLVVGESRDFAVPPRLALGDPAVRERLRAEVLAQGRLRGYAALDYFVFPRGHFGPLPPFLIGRAGFDNWLVWRARQVGPVVDVTRSVVSVHQSHDYSHISGGLRAAYYGEEADWNRELAGGEHRIYSLHDVTHRLGPRGSLYRYWGSPLRAREKARVTRARLRWKASALLGRGLAGRPARVIGVFPSTTSFVDDLTETVAEFDDLELVILYESEPSPDRAPFVAESDRHWVMRRTRIPGAKRVLGHDYPVNWAIWRALFRLTPRCVVVAGWSTFAAQATIAWCWARKVPYILVLENLPPSRGARSVVSRVITRASGIVLTGRGQGTSGPTAASDATVPVARWDGSAAQVVELIRTSCASPP
jgi:hypothetical protein